MSININNGVANIKQTPGAYSGDFSGAPVATGVPVGTLWFDYVNGVIYQSDGTTWQSLGGSGGAQDLQQTCNIGNTVTAISYIAALELGISVTTGAFGLSIFDTATNENVTIQKNSVQVNSAAGDVANLVQNQIEFITGAYAVAINNTTTTLKTTFNSTDIGFSLNFLSGVFLFGDHANQIKGDFLEIDNTNEWIKTKMSNVEFGLFVDRTVGTWIGDYNGIGNNTYIKIDDVAQTIDGGNSIGARFEIAGTRVKIGDIFNVANSSQFGIDDNIESLIATSNLLTGTSSGSSGQHIKIRIGGTDYVIDLKNP